jgi:pimeloyl-ACP methyl ester carboxylesterase
VILAHGFTRTRATMAGHANTLAHDGYWVVVPDLPFLLDSRDNAVALRDLMTRLRAGVAGVVLDRFVLVGFSAGGLSALLAADAPGVAGYIGLDPFDRPSGVGLDAARKLSVPSFLLRGPSAGCNAYAIAEPWVRAFPHLVADRQLAPASHCDFEAPTDRLCRFVCGDTTAANQVAVTAFLRDAVRRALTADSGTGRVAGPAQAQVEQVSHQAQQQP